MANSISNVLLNIRVSNFGAKQSLSEMANGFTLLQGSIALVGTQMTKTAIAFEKAMREVNALAQESEVNFKKFSAEIIKLTDDPKITAGPTALAKSMTTLVGSGFEAAESIQLAGVAAKSASAGMTDAGVSVKALATLMNSYNQKTLKDAIKFSDELFRVVDKGVISYEELATNLGSVIATASSAKISFKEVGAGFIELTRAGINASESETALNNLFRSLTDITPQVAQNAKIMGVELSETALQTKGLEGVLKDMSKATGGSLELMQKLIPEARAAKAALVLAKDGASGFSRALGEMNTSAGSTDRALAEISKAYAFEIDKMKQSIETLGIAYGEIILEAVKELTPYLKAFLDYLINLDDWTKKIIVKTGLYTTAIAAALIAIKGFLLVGVPLISMFTTLALKVSAGTVALSTFITTVKTAMLLLGAPASTALFIGIVAGAVSAAGAVWGVVEALKMLKAQQEENDRYEALNAQKKQAQNELNIFNRKKAEGKKLTADDYRKAARASAVASTFKQERSQLVQSSNKELGLTADDSTGYKIDPNSRNQNQLRQQAIEYGNQAKLLDKELEDKRKAEAEKAKITSENAKKTFLEKQKNLKSEKDANQQAERYAEELKQKRIDVENDLINIKKDAVTESKRLTLSDYEYQKFLVNQEYLEKKKNLDDIKKYNIDTTEAEKVLANNLNLSLKEIEKKRLEDIQNSLKLRQDAEKSNSAFIKDLSRQTELITADDKKSAQIQLEEQLESLKENFERTKESMTNMKDSFGKNIFSKEQIQAFSNSFSTAYNNFKKQSENQINKVQFGKSIEENINKIKEKFDELNDNEKLLAGERIRLEKETWQSILDETQRALAEKQNLTAEDIKKLEAEQKEARKNISRANRDNDKLIIQSRQNLSQSLSSMLSSTGLISNEASNAFSLFTSNTDDLNNSLLALKSGGLQGLDKFAKAGGNLNPLISATTLAITQVKELGKAIIDNLRPIEDFSDFSNMMRDMSSGLWKSVTLGLYDPKQVEKLAGIKSNEYIRRIAEERIKLIKDEEEAVKANYELQRKTIKETIFDSEERNVKLKVLEQELSKDLADILKKRANQEKERIDKLKEYNLTITKLSFDNESIIYNEADKAIKQLGISFQEINKNTSDSLENEKEKLLVINNLAEKLFEIRDNHFENIEKLMSKYYEQEKKHILANYKTELQTIKDKEKKIKENEKQLSLLRAELEKIEKEFAKKLENKNLSKTALTEFNTARNQYMSNNVGVNSLIATPTSEFERNQEAEKEKLDILLEQGSITAQEHAEKLKQLALEQNIYWTEISKNLVKGTREYDEAVKKANDGFRDYKDAVKDSLEAQKQAQIETFNTGTEVVNLTEKINNLTDENANMQKDISDTKLVIDSVLDSLDLKFKDVTGGWVTDINSVTSALSGISTGAQTAISELNKLKEAKKTADETINQFGLDKNKPATSEQLKKIEGQTATKAATEFLSISNSFLSSMKPVTQVKKPDQLSKDLTSVTNLFSNLKFDDGGISQGPKSGYPAILHGKELILNEAQGDNLAVIFRLANSNISPSYSANYPTNDLPPQIIINGSGLSEDQLISATTKALKTIDRNRRNSYA